MFVLYSIYHFLLDTTTLLTDNDLVEEYKTPLSPLPDLNNQVAPTPSATGTPPAPVPAPTQPPIQPAPALDQPNNKISPKLVVPSIILLVIAIILVAFKLIMKK